MSVKNLPEAKARRERRSQARAVGVLLAATVAWGGTFVVVKSAVSHTSVANFLTWRFLIAGGLLAGLRPRSLMQLGRRDMSRAALLGLVLAAGYLVQTLGLRHTTAAISGFLTGLQVVFTPLLAWVLLHHRIRPRVWLASVVAIGGLGVMSLRGFSLSSGELLTVASAAIFALQVIGLSEWSTPANAYGMATAQLLTVAACSSLATLPSGPSLSANAGVWGAIIGTALLATSFAFVAQSWAQSRLSAARAALVLTMEPVFAALTAWAAGGTIGALVLVGGTLVLAAMLLVEVGEARDNTGTAASSAPEQRSDDAPSTTGHLSQRTTGQSPNAALQPAHARPPQ
ncbi:MAG: DMT family transporter [Acidimicrobiales bacterium]